MNINDLMKNMGWNLLAKKCDCGCDRFNLRRDYQWSTIAFPRYIYTCVECKKEWLW